MSKDKFKRLKKSNSSDKTSSKIVNIIKILSMIDAGEKVTASRLSEELEVSEKTIYRYIRAIQDAGIPISYDKDKKSYDFDGNFSLKKVIFNPEEFSNFMSVRNIISGLGFPSDAPFFRVVERILSNTNINLQEKTFPMLVNLGMTVQSPENEKILSILNQAIIDRCRVWMKYYAYGTKEITEREVAPYGLIYCDGFWYMIGMCDLRNATRTFAIDGIREIRSTNHRYAIPKDFNLAEYFSKSFKIVVGNDVEVVVRFSSEVADHILRKRWHRFQKAEKKPNGDVILYFNVAGTEEIKRWLFSWIPHCEILSPPYLRDEVKSELKKTLKKYL
ncbi:MAG: transcriptional regulator [Candidatus Schekmanbacteria bacterium]|nr:MAG: transcriptional regulator [Candidatus Schekmanbacteria bacterium]